MQVVQLKGNKTMHEIRFCKISEYNLLVDFLNKHWKKDHIFTKDKSLLDWQHLSEKENRYNFVVAYNKITKEFDAILGFIPSSQYDIALEEEREIWLAIWKVKENMSDKVSGIQLLFYINSKLKPSAICSIGITKDVRSIYDAFKYKRGNLKHFYIIPENYQANISNIKYKIKDRVKQEDYIIKEIFFATYNDKMQNIVLKSKTKFKKSIRYIHNRFKKHPKYSYKIYGIFYKEMLVSFFIARKIITRESSVIRIVDYYGDFIKDNICSEFQKLLEHEGAEYIDLLCYVSNSLDLETMGFVKKSEKDVIPEYFEPLVKKNVTIEYAYKSKDDIFIFKADSDQDRPNIN